MASSDKLEAAQDAQYLRSLADYLAKKRKQEVPYGSLRIVYAVDDAVALLHTHARQAEGKA